MHDAIGYHAQAKKRDTFLSDDHDRLSTAGRRSDDYIVKLIICTFVKNRNIDSGIVNAITLARSNLNVRKQKISKARNYAFEGCLLAQINLSDFVYKNDIILGLI